MTKTRPLTVKDGMPFLSKCDKDAVVCQKQSDHKGEASFGIYDLHQFTVDERKNRIEVKFNRLLK